jgi:hypothetical protein
MIKTDVILNTNAVFSFLFAACSLAVGLLGIWVNWRSEMQTIRKD